MKVAGNMGRCRRGEWREWAAGNGFFVEKKIIENGPYQYKSY